MGVTARLSARDRRIAALAVPALGTLAIEPLYVLVDTAIVGRLGTVPLGGLALASTVLNTLLFVCNFLAYGTTARVAFLTGRGDDREAAGVAAQGLWLTAVIGFPAAIAVAVGARALVAALGGTEDVLEAGATYLRISAAGIPAVLVALVGHGYLRGLSDTRTPLRVAVVANLLNVVLEVLLVYGWEFGVAGSAWGTVAAQWVAAAWFLRLLGSRLADADAGLAPRWREIAGLVIVGRQLAARTAALLVALGMATSVASRVGPATLAGHQIALQVHSFLALALDALAIPGQAFVGTALGAGDHEEARAMGRRLLQIGAGAGAGLCLVVLAVAVPLPRIFTTDPAVIERATLALLVVAVLQIPSSVAFVLDGVLMGASDFRFLQWTMLAALLLFLPFAGAVLVWPRFGIVGLWTGLLAWMLGRAAFTAARFRSPRWPELPVATSRPSG